jgi:glutamate/tyrosine decarboxylase-like PLP-dependent enzyme
MVILIRVQDERGQRLESTATPFPHHDPEDQLRELLADAATRAYEYLVAIRDRHAGVRPEALVRLKVLGGDLPTRGENSLELLRLLDEAGSPATVASAGGRFFGGVVGGALPATVAAQWLAAAWDQNACLFDFSPAAAYLEDVVLGWLLNLLGLPPSSGGAFVTGTQMADVTALAAARTSVLRKAGWNVEEDGLAGAPPVTVVVGEEVHATMIKALTLLGLGKKRSTSLRPTLRDACSLR